MLISLSGLRSSLQQEKGSYTKLKDLPKATKLVFSRLPFIFITAGACLEAFIVSTTIAFIPKVMEAQFYLPPGRSALLFGLITVPCAFLGNLIGKWCKRRQDFIHRLKD